jgi:hypothetical protein
LPAKAVCQATLMQLTAPLRGQASLLQGFVLFVRFGNTICFVFGHRSSGDFVVNFGLVKILYINVQKDSVHGSSHS